MIGFEENFNGYLAILKGCVLIRGKTSTALSLALPTNLVLAAIEALFHYRVVRAYHISSNLSSSVVFEGLFITYLHAILIVVDTIVSCEFYRSCKQSCNFDLEGGDILDSYRVGIEAGDVTYVNVKSVELP
ncbi:hypothetical protein RJ641_014599 [Dillenia turbinata]|uniref:Uncharacterized protein n=1 Tax=Dillenia turbinata TaxID=194707 RepID=A0AAN8V058_9MAGN